MSSRLALAKSVLTMLTAMVSGCGLTSVVGVLEVDGVPAVEQLRGERRDRDRGVDRLVVERDGVLRERNDLDVDVVDGQAHRISSSLPTS